MVAGASAVAHPAVESPDVVEVAAPAATAAAELPRPCRVRAVAPSPATLIPASAAAPPAATEPRLPTSLLSMYAALPARRAASAEEITKLNGVIRDLHAERFAVARRVITATLRWRVCERLHAKTIARSLQLETELAEMSIEVGDAEEEEADAEVEVQVLELRIAALRARLVRFDTVLPDAIADREADAAAAREAEAAGVRDYEALQQRAAALELEIEQLRGGSPAPARAELPFDHNLPDEWPSPRTSCASPRTSCASPRTSAPSPSTSAASLLPCGSPLPHALSAPDDCTSAAGTAPDGDSQSHVLRGLARESAESGFEAEPPYLAHPSVL
eukprot:NODE_7703_length_1557_cov_3.011189.p1 GENE.NODE_7703_length_1557_cov_3.011189~~NODE_7703_length_1557_cov_3.011189.p1  ORF type:complete len:383 (+),score=148.29 NODE_7703_length_1557_cov_3.011189:154-1149(+)